MSSLHEGWQARASISLTVESPMVTARESITMHTVFVTLRIGISREMHL
jgi:hypothetical protein